ncbi:MAG: ABC transporter permease [Candidatus Hodarchaeota archaeon]
MPISKSYVRLLTRGITFSTRSRKRLIVFLIVFAILAGMTILLVERWIEYDREDLLKQRGVILRNSDFGTVSGTEGDDLYQQILSLSQVESATIVKFFNFNSSLAGGNDAGLRIFGIDITKPWHFAEVNPSTIVRGGYLETENQVLVSDSAQFQSAYSQNNNTLQTDIIPGNTLSFVNPSKSGVESFYVAGLYEEVTGIANDPEDREWLILSLEGYEKLRDYLDISVSQTFTYEITAIALGNPVLGDAYDQTDNLRTEITNLKETNNYGSWDAPDWVSKGQKIPERDRDLLTFTMGILGSLLVSTMYAYLISRFRRRDIAILKALGYNANQVRMGLLAEILTVAGLGYIVAAGVIVFGLTFLTAAVLVRGVSYLALTVSLGGVVLFTVPGMLLVSKKALSVRPIEIFRER